MRGYGGFEEFIRARGGIVSRAELLAAGWTADELRIAYGLYGQPTRLRRGWYCSSDVPDEVREAWVHGGPLACVSALRWHGLLPPGDPDEAMHVCLPSHGKTRQVRSSSTRPVVRHWHDAAVAPGNRWAVPLSIALEQARHCREAWATRALMRER